MHASLVTMETAEHQETKNFRPPFYKARGGRERERDEGEKHGRSHVLTMMAASQPLLQFAQFDFQRAAAARSADRVLASWSAEVGEPQRLLAPHGQQPSIQENSPLAGFTARP